MCPPTPPGRAPRPRVRFGRSAPRSASLFPVRPSPRGSPTAPPAGSLASALKRIRPPNLLAPPAAPRVGSSADCGSRAPAENSGTSARRSSTRCPKRSPPPPNGHSSPRSASSPLGCSARSACAARPSAPTRPVPSSPPPPSGGRRAHERPVAIDVPQRADAVPTKCRQCSAAPSASSSRWLYPIPTEFCGIDLRQGRTPRPPVTSVSQVGREPIPPIRGEKKRENHDEHNRYHTHPAPRRRLLMPLVRRQDREASGARSEEHTSELQSLGHLVCRLLLAKQK